MHELGILLHALKTVSGVAENNSIKSIKHITLEVGEESGVVPDYMNKLYPVATDSYPLFKNAELRLEMVPGKGLVIKEIGY